MRDHRGAETAYRKALELKPDYAEAALNLGTVLQEFGDLDGAIRAYATAYRLRPQMFGSIAMALTSAPHGRLWLRRSARLAPEWTRSDFKSVMVPRRGASSLPRRARKRLR